MLEKLVVYFYEGSGRAHLDCRLSYRLVLTGYHHQETRLSLQQHPQLRRLSFRTLDPSLQSPPSVAWYIAVVRWREGRSRRRCHYCRRPCRSLLRFPQVSYYRYQPNISISELTSDSKLVPPLSSAAASRAMLRAASLSLLRWSWIASGQVCGELLCSWGAEQLVHKNNRWGQKVAISSVWK
jgi:hypothetical protein